MPAQWQTSLRQFVEHFENADLTEAFEAVDEVISAGFEQNFYNQVDDNDQPWKPRVDSLPHPLLIKTGKMFAAATKTDDPGHLKSITTAEIAIGIKGSVVSYAIFHHVGTRKMPARRVVYATQETVNLALERFADIADRLID